MLVLKVLITLLYFFLGLGDEAVNTVDNLIATMEDVNLKVTTKRSDHEEEALHRINNIINQLVSQAQNEVHSTKELCHVYIRHCCKSGEKLYNRATNM